MIKKAILGLVAATVVTGGVVTFKASGAQRLTNERAKLESNVDGLNENIDMLLRKASVLYDNATYRAEVDAETITNKNSQIAILEADSATLIEQLESVKSELEAAKVKLSEAETKYTNTESELTATKTTLTEISAKLDKAKTDINSLNSQVETLSGEKTELQNNLEKANSQVNIANQFVSDEADELARINDKARPMDKETIKALPSTIDVPVVE